MHTQAFSAAINNCVNERIGELGSENAASGGLGYDDFALGQVFWQKFPGRRDLRNLRVFSVENPTFKTLENAISIELKENGPFQIGIHFADPCSFVSEGDQLDIEASTRLSNQYVSNYCLSLMLPERLSENAAALVAKLDRLAISLMFEMDENGLVDCESIKIMQSVINKQAQLTFQEVEEILQRGVDRSRTSHLEGDLVALWQLS